MSDSPLRLTIPFVTRPVPPLAVPEPGYLVDLSVVVVALPNDAARLRDLAGSQGYRTTVVERGENVAERVRRDKPDCVLIRNKPPDLDGLATQKALGDADGRFASAIVWVGEGDDARSAVAALKAGALDYLVDGDLDAVGLGTAIRGAVEHHRRQEQQRWRAEENAHLAAIVASSSDAIVSLGPDGATFKSWSPAATQLFGYTEDEAIGRTVDELLIPDFKRDERQELKSAVSLGGKAIIVETERRHKDGTIIPVEINVSPIAIFEGDVVGYSVIFRDVRERGRAQQAIRDSQQRLARREAELTRAQRIARIGSYEVDCRNGQFINRRSPEYLAIHGLKPEDWNEPHDAWVQRMHPDDRDWSNRAFQEAVANGATEYEAEYRIIRPSDGELRWIKVLAEIDRDPSGKPERLFGTHIDITERKRAEERMLMLMREVNHRSKNMLSVVQAIARQTTATRHDDFLVRFTERIQSLSASHDLLVENDWKGVAFEELARSQLAHLHDMLDRRIVLAGPPFRLTAAAAQIIGMVLHELATNAAKYGALSIDRGRVEVQWGFERRGEWDELGFALVWLERDGPEVEAPVRKGFGSTVLTRMAKMGLEAEVDLRFAPEGLEWRLTCSADKVRDGAGTATSRGPVSAAGP